MSKRIVSLNDFFMPMKHLFYPIRVISSTFASENETEY